MARELLMNLLGKSKRIVMSPLSMQMRPVVQSPSLPKPCWRCLRSTYNNRGQKREERTPSWRWNIDHRHAFLIPLFIPPSLFSRRRWGPWILGVQMSNLQTLHRKHSGLILGGIKRKHSEAQSDEGDRNKSRSSFVGREGGRVVGGLYSGRINNINAGSDWYIRLDQFICLPGRGLQLEGYCVRLVLCVKGNRVGYIVFSRRYENGKSQSASAIERERNDDE